MLSDSKKKEQRSLGTTGEKLVANFLEQQGFTILEKNYRTRVGEVDLIASTKNLLAFVEVKTRSQVQPSIADLVPHSKQQKIIRAARYYLVRHHHETKSWRFDVAYVHNGNVHYVPNAFTEQQW